MFDADLLFKKIADSVPALFDIEELEKTFIEDQFNPIEEPIIHPSGKPHWQYYIKTQLYVARNMSNTFPSEMNKICEQLKCIQNQCKADDFLNKNSLVKEFCSSPITAENISFIKIPPKNKNATGHTIQPHCDIGRKLALNIGLKNSNSCTTHIIDSTTATDFSNHEQYSYNMNDGEAWLLKVSNAHAVTSHSDTVSRYILTYTVANIK
jgi:hypothetical protein